VSHQNVYPVVPLEITFRAEYMSQAPFLGLLDDQEGVSQISAFGLRRAILTTYLGVRDNY
jgi:hypothetical protein